MSCLTALLVALAVATPAGAQTLFRQVHVFDGTRDLGKRDVLVRGDRIAAVAPRLTAPAGVTAIDGAGKKKEIRCAFRFRIDDLQIR